MRMSSHACVCVCACVRVRVRVRVCVCARAGVNVWLDVWRQVNVRARVYE